MKMTFDKTIDKLCGWQTPSMHFILISKCRHYIGVWC